MFWSRECRRVTEALARIEAKLGGLTMTLDDLITAINDETNTVANRIDNLKSELAAALSQGSPVTQAQLDELAAISTKLQGLGADPANPVPSTTPTPATGA